ncbi:MAG: hypothetical protein L0227_02760 [Chloroflexi bacterium]|nr:hypothetical protein [Chloroflexota bacterium]
MSPDVVPAAESSASTDQTSLRSRRALLVGALGGLAAAAAAALGRPAPAAAAAGSSLIIGSEANNAGTANTQLIANSNVVTFKLYQQGPGTALMGYTTTATGTTRGVYGRVDSPNGDGVQGRNGGAAGTGAAVRAYGVNNDGVVGTTDNADRFGVKGIAPGTGVYGQATATSGSVSAVLGVADNVEGYGVQGVNNAAGAGIRGVSNGNVGVLGESTGGLGVAGTSDTDFGVAGSSTSSAGVYGVATSGYAGMYGESSSGYGVIGLSSSSAGVYGSSTTGAGMHGSSTSGYGVRGESGSGYALYGESASGNGVRGGSTTSGNGVSGLSSSGYGVYGFSGSNAGVYGTSITGYAGYFDGALYANSAHANVKAFRIDHPLDPAGQVLMHSCVESNERKLVYDGVVTTDAKGEATIELPAYFGALNRDLRYQLTVIGSFAQAMVQSKVTGNRFTIATSEPRVEVSWQISGVRQDAYAKAHPLVVESAKTGREKGRYLNPLEHGQPASSGVDFELRQRLEAVPSPA